MTERRQHFRRRTLLDGRLEIAAINGWTLDCTVRNLSEAGARLTVPAHVVVPRNVSLAVSNGPQRPARLIWYREGQAGFAIGEERRSAPRPMPANDVLPVPSADRFAARLAAITAKVPAAPRFTRP